MSEAEEQAFVAAVESDFMHDDDTAARAHLAAGRDIYYRKPDTPTGLVIREYPGGRRELVRVTAQREFHLFHAL